MTDLVKRIGATGNPELHQRAAFCQKTWAETLQIAPIALE
jgi:hypothetical protein